MLIVECGESVHRALSRAVMLARHFKGRLHLVLAESDWSKFPISTGGEAADRLPSAQSYLDSLCASVGDPDLVVTSEVVGVRSQRQSLVQLISERRPDVVVRPAHAQPDSDGGFLRSDLRFARACPAPLLLTSGRPWHAKPRLAALVYPLDPQGAAATRLVATLAARLREVCQGELEILTASSAVGEGVVSLASRCWLSDLARQSGGAASGPHLVDAQSSLARLLGEQEIDVLIHSAPESNDNLFSEPESPSLLSTPNGALMAMDCDLLFVRAGRTNIVNQLAVN
jgi:hypothetical protein